MKRRFAFFLALFLLVCPALSDTIPAGTTTVTLTVPSSYAVTVQCGANGYFSAGGVEYSGDTSFTVDRETGLTVLIHPRAGYVPVVTLSTDKGVTLSGNTLAFGDSLLDITVVLRFEPAAGTSIVLDRGSLVLAPGMRWKLTACLSTGDAIEGVAWSSGDESVLTVDANGVITAVSSGTAAVTVTDGTLTSVCAVTVRSLNTLAFPKAMTTLKAESMRGNTSVERVILPEGVSSIGDRAFEGCTGLLYITIPSMHTTFGTDCFSGCGEMVIICPAGSDAEQYALSHGIACQSEP